MFWLAFGGRVAVSSPFFSFQLRAPVFPTPGQSEEWGWRHALRGARCTSTTAGAEPSGTNTEVAL